MRKCFTIYFPNFLEIIEKGSKIDFPDKPELGIKKRKEEKTDLSGKIMNLQSRHKKTERKGRETY